MSENRSRFFIGLFVTIGLLIGVVAIVWLGVSNYFTEGDRYVTYFDESVQGLSADSTVKYRGVTVGRVESITIAPDNRLIEVIMKIDIDEELHKTTVAQLRPLGITGMVFIELNRRTIGDPERVPVLSFPVEYPVIPSRPSGISEIFSRLHVMADRLMEIDLKGLSEDLQAVMGAARSILSDPKIAGIVKNLEGTLGRLESAVAGMETIMEEGKPGTIMAELRDLIGEGRQLVSQVEAAVREADIPEASKQAVASLEGMEKQTGLLAENLDRAMRFTAFEIRDLASQLRQTANAMDQLLERLSLNPSDIIFSRPAEPHREGEPWHDGTP